ncbi:ARM repeat-containing protein [Ascobolus immersus RN42]|uniref:ARM repeat-containing protein n=1 Tax=Ascobolus immersus RN42 TaxID=1160509 RepID=A0A3N4IEU2_ASCIM|nr:ARM repeat-containing protein [Ascobolus immersus RN42]
MSHNDGVQQYVDGIYTNIRTRTVAWKALARSGAINDADSTKLDELSKDVSPETQETSRMKLFEKDTDAYVKLLFGEDGETGVLKKVAENAVVVSVLLILSDALSSEKFRVTVFKSVDDPFKVLIHLLDKGDESVKFIASRDLGNLIAHALTKTYGEDKVSEEKQLLAKRALAPLYTYLSDGIKNGDNNVQDLCMQGYVNLVRNKGARRVFWANSEDELDESEQDQSIPLVGRSRLATPLINILRKATPKDAQQKPITSNVDPNEIQQGDVSLQLLYHTLLVIWSLSFEEQVTSTIQSDYQIIWTLLLLMKSAIKEKIARLSIGILANLLHISSATNLPALSIVHPLPMLTGLQERYTTDPDIVEDLDFIVTSLEQYLANQTTLDNYKLEVEQGKLSWSAMHRNENFWKKHANDIFDYDRGSLIDKLVDVIEEGWKATERGEALPKDRLVPIHVAVHDCAALLNECPERRKVLEEKGVKKRCLGLMGSVDPELRFEALQVVNLFLKNAFAPRY